MSGRPRSGSEAAGPGSAPRPAARAARGWSRERSARDRRRAGRRGRARPSRCSKIVHHQQQMLGRQERSTACSARLACDHDDPKRPDDRRGNVLGSIARPASDTKRAPSANSASTARAASSASRVLPTPPGPGQRQQPDEPPQSLGESRELVLATDRAIRRRPAATRCVAGRSAAGAGGASRAGSWARIASWRS